MEEQNKIQEQTIEIEQIDINELPDTKIGQINEKPTLDGQTTIITNITLTPLTEQTTKDGTKTYKPILFRIHYGDPTQYENYGGVQQFKKEDGTYEPPTIWLEGKSSAAKLLKKWLEHTKQQPENISYKDFFKNLIGQKVKLKTITTKYNHEEYKKNIIDQFIN